MNSPFGKIGSRPAKSPVGSGNGFMSFPPEAAEKAKFYTPEEVEELLHPSEEAEPEENPVG